MKIDDVIQRHKNARTPPWVPRPVSKLPAPPYRPDPAPHKGDGSRVGLAVESMKRHTTDEGWQLFDGLKSAGYSLIGHALPVSMTNVPSILEAFKPGTLVLQDKREWDGLTAGGTSTFDSRERFSGVEELRNRSDVFKVTVLKDAQNGTDYHRISAEEIGCHAWIIYYHPRIVAHLAPYVREQHLVRTYHSIDQDTVPEFSPKGRSGCLLSGAVSGAYPLRKKIFDWHHNKELDGMTLHFPHPGYHRRKCHTPEFLARLSEFKVAVCTSSTYGYALRKIIEATACGCRVITNLPEDEQLPHIDDNLTRINDDISVAEMRDLIHRLIDTYDPLFQDAMAEACKYRYDYREVGVRLSRDIEQMRRSYNGPNT